MKKSLSIYGLCTCLLVFVGTIFKVLHWPNGTVILLILAPIFISLFLILYAGHLSKTTDKSKFAIWFSAIVLILFIAGGSFKMLHWPNAFYLLLSSSILGIIDFFVLLVRIIKK